MSRMAALTSSASTGRRWGMMVRLLQGGSEPAQCHSRLRRSAEAEFPRAWSPTLHAFHSVLEAYTRSPRISIQAMLDLVVFVEHQDMCPNVETYSLLVVGIVRDHAIHNNWTDVLTTAMNRMEEKWKPSDQLYHYLRGYSRAIRWALKKKQWTLDRKSVV